MIEVLCLALNVYFEARGEPIDGQIAVLDVTMNRVAAPQWPDSACGVVTQPHQFSWTTAPVTSSKDPIWPFVLMALEAPSLGVTADHYHATSVQPYWAEKLTYEGKIGGHLFYASF